MNDAPVPGSANFEIFPADRAAVTAEVARIEALVALFQGNEMVEVQDLDWRTVQNAEEK